MTAPYTPAAHDIADLMWHGQRLSSALHRAADAEAEAAELRISLDHCLAMGAERAEQISSLSLALDEARAEAADLRRELAYRLGPAVTPRCRVGSPDGSDGDR
jgi:hypothetical protein